MASKFWPWSDSELRVSCALGSRSLFSEIGGGRSRRLRSYHFIPFQSTGSRVRNHGGEFVGVLCAECD